MTQEEAIKYLRQLYPHGGSTWLDEKRMDAITMAVNALERTEPALNMKPKKYKAKDTQGRSVTGWYVELHQPHYDNDIPDRVVGFDIIPSLFNDENGERSKGSYWHVIDPATLQEAN